MPEDMPDKTTKRGISSTFNSEEGNKKIPKLTLQSSSPVRALKKEPPKEDDSVFVGIYTPPRACPDYSQIQTTALVGGGCHQCS